MKRAKKGKRKKSERGRERRTGRDVALCQNAALDPVFRGRGRASTPSPCTRVHARARATCNFKPQKSLAYTLRSFYDLHTCTRARARARTQVRTRRGWINHRDVSIGHTIFPRIAYECTHEKNTHTGSHTRNPQPPRIRVHRRTCNTRATQDARARVSRTLSYGRLFGYGCLAKCTTSLCILGCIVSRVSIHSSPVLHPINIHLSSPILYDRVPLCARHTLFLC